MTCARSASRLHAAVAMSHKESQATPQNTSLHHPFSTLSPNCRKSDRNHQHTTHSSSEPLQKRRVRAARYTLI